MVINSIVIDDEPLARKGIINYIKQISFINLRGEYASPIDALKIIDEENINLIFLDIQMPVLTGLEFLKTLPSPPITIITTAYPNYALQSFELNVIDYLVKPIPFERFVKAVNKAKDFFELKKKAEAGIHTKTDYFFIKCEGRYEKILLDELLYVEALQNYVVLHTVGRSFICYLTFKSVEEYLPSDYFLKVQKSFIVSVSKIESIDGDQVVINNKKIAISRANKDEILNSILQDKLLKR
jgi:DNA-binding LytR/AlgR family response regulator